ncbi:hypothetical protein B0T18DRAFT_478256 [Schizothecium vesticola]|uniref:Phytanoyl-CoA dioxygenase n=1 Tax=Schizothecium vesticola TaxID=314040 RepID=A0AA40F570_9PEZI|nr:hypothetical protein B0T18DRAFT_478256 [Schizothecium vesticola]
MADQTPTPGIAAQLLANGYAIIPSFLRPSELADLRAAATALTDQARLGHWPHVRTVGKQFPPWPTPTPTHPLPIWGVQHLLHPSLPISPSHRAAFTNLYFSPRLLAHSTALLTATSQPKTPSPNPHPNTPTTTSDLVLELFNLLVTPRPVPPAARDDPTPFSLTWHRDDIPPTATAAEELAALQRPAFHAQWNLPLCDGDASLVVVPGSHVRARTAAERCAAAEGGEMPGEVRVVLGAGDVVFYDSNILHRGVYEGGGERMTLHGSVGHVKGEGGRARNVLQHGVGEWVGGMELGCLGEGTERRAVAEGMRGRLVEMGRGWEGGEFSLEG